jgi:hypothetical protein
MSSDHQRGSPSFVRPAGASFLCPPPGPDTFPQEEVFEDKLSFARGERTTAGATDYLAIICFGASFDFDDFMSAWQFGHVNELRGLPAMLRSQIHSLLVEF